MTCKMCNCFYFDIIVRYVIEYLVTICCILMIRIRILGNQFRVKEWQTWLKQANWNEAFQRRKWTIFQRILLHGNVTITHNNDHIHLIKVFSEKRRWGKLESFCSQQTFGIINFTRYKIFIIGKKLTSLFIWNINIFQNK